MSHNDYMFFLLLYISSDFCFTYFCFFVVRCLIVYNIYMLWELYLLLLKIFIFVKKKIIFGFNGSGSWLLVVTPFFFSLTFKNIMMGSG